MHPLRQSMPAMPKAHVVAKGVPWHKSVRTRLSAVAAFLVLAATVSLTTGSAMNSFSSQTRFAAEQTQGVANVMAMALSRPMALDDTQSMTRVISSLGNLERVDFAIVLDPDGKVVTRAGVGVFLTDNLETMKEITAFNLLQRDTFWLDQEIVYAGEKRGTLYLLSNLSELRSNFLDRLIIDVALSLFVSLLAGLTVYATVSRMTRPIASLARLMESLGLKPQPGRRADVATDDEVGALANSFNGMLDKLEQRELDLNEYRLHLEDKVEQRTHDLQLATLEAEEANRAKSDFLATMSHEIRTPMNGMMVMAEMLAKSDLPDRQRRQADIIRRSGGNLLAIINDILDLSKIEAGAIEFETIGFSVETLVGDCASLFDEKAREAGLVLATSIAPDVPEELMGDPTRINQIVTNLVNNALKFTETGGVHVHVGVLGTHDGTCQLEIRVRDTGIGIAEDKQKSVFEAFTQAEQSTTRKFGGTGLGLSICTKLAQAMGGELALESTLGVGSTFIFRAPLAIGEAAITGRMPALAGTPVAVLCDNPFSAAIVQTTVAAHGGHIVGDGENLSMELVDTYPSLLVLADAGSMEDERTRHIVSMNEGLTVALSTSIAQPELDMPDWADGAVSLCFGPASLARLSDAVASGDRNALSRRDESVSDGLDAMPRFDGLRVLAVDDNAINREVIGETLGALGVKPDFAASGPEAIELARKTGYDIIFMDCSMPGMDGYETTGHIRKLEIEAGRAPTHITALTAHALNRASNAHLEAGMNSYVTKPFVINDIAAELMQVATPVERAASGTTHDETADISGSAGDHHDAQAVDVVTEPDGTPILSEEAIAMFRQLGDPMLIKVLSMYQTHGPDGLEKLRAGVVDHAPTREISDLAHALKSMSASSGAEAMRLVAEHIEHMAADGAMPTDDDLAEAERVLAETLDAMTALLAMLQADDIPSQMTA